MFIAIVTMLQNAANKNDHLIILFPLNSYILQQITRIFLVLTTSNEHITTCIGMRKKTKLHMHPYKNEQHTYIERERDRVGKSDTKQRYN